MPGFICLCKTFQDPTLCSLLLDTLFENAKIKLEAWVRTQLWATKTIKYGGENEKEVQLGTVAHRKVVRPPKGARN